MIPNGFRRIALAHSLLPDHTHLRMPSASPANDSRADEGHADDLPGQVAAQAANEAILFSDDRPA